MSSAERKIDYSTFNRNYGAYRINQPRRSTAEKRYAPDINKRNRLARIPESDEFRRSTEKTRNVSQKKPASNGIKKSSRKTKMSSTLPDYKNMTASERRQYREYRKKQRQIAALKRKCLQIGLPIASSVMLLLGAKNIMSSNGVETKANEANSIIYETEDNYGHIDSEDLKDTDFIFDEETNTVYIDKINDIKEATPFDAEELLNEAKQAQIEEVKQILDENPDIKEAFNDIEISLRRASIEYGGNIIELLEEMNDKFGLDNLPLELQIGVMEQETAGFFTDWKTNQIIVNKDGDTGWYQLTDTAEEDFNRIANWLIKRGASEEDIDDIKNKSEGRFTMRGNAGHGAMVLSYLNYKYDGDFKKILSAYNAGENFVNNGGIRESYVQECYHNHIEPLSRYEVLWNYIIDRDYYEFEDDGVPHVYVNPEDGSVRYPD